MKQLKVLETAKGSPLEPLIGVTDEFRLLERVTILADQEALFHLLDQRFVRRQKPHANEEFVCRGLHDKRVLNIDLPEVGSLEAQRGICLLPLCQGR